MDIIMSLLDTAWRKVVSARTQHRCAWWAAHGVAQHCTAPVTSSEAESTQRYSVSHGCMGPATIVCGLAGAGLRQRLLSWWH